MVVAALALPHLVLPAAPAGAADETSKRVHHREAEFPSASWKKGEGLSTSRFRTRDTCPAYRKVVAKVDPGAAMNRTLLRNSGKCGSGFLILALDDRQGGGEETRALSNPREPRIASLTVTGTILSRDWSPPAWRTSFGRMAAPMRLTGAHGRSAEGLVCPFGIDCERARRLAGATPSYRIGEGGFSAAGRYGLDVSLSEVHPYVRVTLTRRLSVWWTYRF